MSQTVRTLHERPILFTPWKVNRILAWDFARSGDMQTRRLSGLQKVNQQPDHWTYEQTNSAGEHLFYTTEEEPESEACIQVIRCPYGRPGDHLYVREAWCPSPDGPIYQASEPEAGMHQPGDRNIWRSARFMPKAVVRLWLELMAVRVERVQQITDADALAEGVDGPGPGVVLPGPFDQGRGGLLGYSVLGLGTFPTARGAFACLWDMLNAKAGHPWTQNEWVWKIVFKKLTP